MSSMMAPLMKRGFDLYVPDEGTFKLDVSGWVIGVLAVTMIVFMYLIFTIEYTFGRVVPALMMIESPADHVAFQAIPTEDDSKLSNGVDSKIRTNPEPVTGRSQYMTSTFRSSMRLLKSEGGCRGRFRGIGMYAANSFAMSWIASILSVATQGIVPEAFCLPIAAVLCAQLSLGWTLVVITETSPKFWFRRVPSFKLWKKIAGPTAVFSILEQVSVFGPLYLLKAVGLAQDPKEIQKLPAQVQKYLALQAICVMAIAIIFAVGILLPARVTLTRMQASLVDESEETIVPFDRTFGGRVVPEVVGGSGMIGALDAWKTFDKSARLRLIMAYVKCFAMVIATTLLFAGIIALEVVLFAPNIQKSFIPNKGN